MGILNSWLQGIIVSVIIATIIQMILPDSSSKKYIKVVLGVYIVFNIITPIVNEVFNNNFKLSSIINTDEYTKKMQTYSTETNNIEINETNKDNIKQIYISNLKNDMKSKLKEKGYILQNVKIELENNAEYTIKKVELSLEKAKEEIEENDDTENKINEIEKVNIEISNNHEINNNDNFNDKETNKEEKLNNNDKKEIIKYISSVYEIKEKQITIN